MILSAAVPRAHSPGARAQQRADLLLEIARPLLPVRPALEPAERARVEEELAGFLARQMAALPGYMRLPMRAGLFAFAWLPLLRHGRPYTRLDPEARRRHVLAWSTSRVGPKRDLVKLIRSCALFFYLDHRLVTARLEAETCELPEEQGLRRAE